MKKVLYVLGGIILILIIALSLFNFGQPEAEAPLITNDANSYFENLSVANGSKISSPLVITGSARGPWFFEASFPVYLTDWDGLIIAEGIAQAEGEWMTTDFVPFKATLTFTKPSYKDNGTLILKKDNPSGLPEHDNALELSVIFE